jgi:hypothetical protein
MRRNDYYSNYCMIKESKWSSSGSVRKARARKKAYDNYKTVKEAAFAPPWLSQGLKNVKSTVGAQANKLKTLGEDVKHITNTSRDGWVRGEAMPFFRNLKGIGDQYIKNKNGMRNKVNTWAKNEITKGAYNPTLRNIVGQITT